MLRPGFIGGSVDPFAACDGGLAGIVAVLVGLNGWEHGDLGVQAAVVESVDVFDGDGERKVIDRSSGPRWRRNSDLTSELNPFGESVVKVSCRFRQHSVAASHR